jgi:tetratricopeptide (TPR) repeat protein
MKGFYLMKKICLSIILIMILYAFMPLQTFAATQNTADDYYYKALQLYSSQKFDEAIINFDLAIKLNPKYLDAYMGMGAALNAMGKYKDAIDAYNKAIKIDPKYVFAYVNKADSYNNLKKYDDASKCLDKAIGLDPKSSGAYVSKGNIFYFQQKYDEAIKFYDIAIGLDPQNEIAFINKGSSLYFLKNYKDCIDAFDKGLKIKPDNAYANYYMSIAKINVNDTDLYLTYLKKAIASDISYADKARAEIAFTGVSENNDFIEAVYDATAKLGILFKNANILNDGTLEGTKFLELDTLGNASDDLNLIQSNNDFLNKSLGGFIYNKATADTYHICKDSPMRDDLIKTMRSLKGYYLIGFKIELNFSSPVITYVGKQSGEIKAVVIKNSSSFELDGKSNTTDEYSIFELNNGIWEYYGYLEGKNSDSSK